MTPSLLTAAAESVALSRILIGLWLMISIAHRLATVDMFSGDGPLAWAELARLRNRPLVNRVRRRMSVATLVVWLVVQLGVAIAVMATTSLPVLIAGLAFLLASHGAAILLSGEFWSSGAEKMGAIVMAGTLITGIGLLIGDEGLALAGIIVSGGQLVLCYFVAGVSKIGEPDWRSGVELRGIIANRIWGHPRAAALIRQPGIGLAASWIVILGEALFPLALVAPAPVLLAALGLMLLFHIATAVVMGLNLFPWAFAAAYPAVWVLGLVVRGALG